jgi:hypothetical protein
MFPEARAELDQLLREKFQNDATRTSMVRQILSAAKATQMRFLEAATAEDVRQTLRHELCTDSEGVCARLCACEFQVTSMMQYFKVLREAALLLGAPPRVVQMLDNKRAEMAARYQEQVDLGLPTPMQVPKQVSWSQALAVVAASDPLTVEGAYLRCLTLFPGVRRTQDWLMAKVLRAGEGTPHTVDASLYRNMRETAKQDKINIVMLTTEDGPAHVVFGKYKTVRVYGVQDFPLPAELAKTLVRYQAARTTASEWLFGNLSGTNHMWHRDMLDKINRLFVPQIGHSINITALRHACITFHLGQADFDTAKRCQLARYMAHSALTQINYMLELDQDHDDDDDNTVVDAPPTSGKRNKTG